MFSRKESVWTVILLTAVLAGACAPAGTPEATAKITSTLVPTPTPGPEETEHQTVMPPAPTFTPEPTSEDGEPLIEVQPLTAAVGRAVVISGENFPANSQVEIGIGRVNSEYDVVDAAQTDAEGNLETTFVIPDFVQPQDNWVIVVRADSGRIEVFSEELEITG